MKKEYEEYQRRNLYHQIRMDRSHRLLCFMMAAIVLIMILTLASVFFDPVKVFMDYFTPTTGFIFAELCRRSTANEETENFRPFTWREIWHRSQAMVKSID